MKVCPYCAEMIQEDAIKCRFCGSMLVQQPPPEFLTPSPPQMTATSIHRRRIWLAVFSAAGIISAFLPWIDAPFIGSVSGIQGTDGWIAVGIFMIGLLSSLSGNRAQLPASGARAGALLSGLAGAAMAIWKISDIYKIRAQAGGDSFAAAMSQAIGVGFGLWLMAIAGVALVVGVLARR